MIIMPILSREETVEEGEEQKNRETKSSNFQEKKPNEQIQESEEYNLLNNMMNKILSNLTLKVKNVSIRVLT